MGGHRLTPPKIVIFWTYEKPHCRGGNYVVGGEEGYLIFFKISIGESWDEWTWSDGSTNDWPEFSHYWTWSDGSTDNGLGISMSKYGNFYNALGLNKDKKFICKVTCPNSINWSKNYRLCKFNFSLVFD